MKLCYSCLAMLLLVTLICGQDKENQNDKELNNDKDREDINQGHTQVTGFTLEDSSWKIVWHGQSDSDLLNAPNIESVLMLTKDNEQYNCLIEKPTNSDEEATDAYGGPNPLQLMEPLFNKMACSYRLESYWTYEVCHGDYVRQYHEAKEGKKTKLVEYFLGRYSQETFEQQVAEWDAAIEKAETPKKPRTLRLEEVDLPYLEVWYRDGTVCDLTGRPRQTQVRYVCHAGSRHEVVSFQETSSCQYVVVVLTPLLCSHPDYRVAADVENQIHCVALANSPKRPRSLLSLEAESLALRHRLSADDEAASGGRQTAPAPAPAPAPDPAPAPATAGRGDEGEEAETPAVYDERLVEEFLAGRHCLNGGTGWWRYEFCHGKRVDQYHVNRDNSRTTVHLGFFDAAVHRQWLRANPQKRPKPAPARRQVSHFYSGGAVCDLTGAPRSVEVKLKCKPSQRPNAVSLYLLEPRPCEYILGVESPIVCRLVQQADEDGLLEE